MNPYVFHHKCISLDLKTWRARENIQKILKDIFFWQLTTTITSLCQLHTTWV